MEWVGELEDLEAEVCVCMVLQGEVSLDGRTMRHVMSQTFSKTEKTCTDKFNKKTSKDLDDLGWNLSVIYR